MICFKYLTSGNSGCWWNIQWETISQSSDAADWSEQNRQPGKENGMEWDIGDQLEPARVSEPHKDTQEPFRFSLPLTFKMEMSFRRNWPLCHTEKKKGDGYGLNHIFT